MPWHRGWTVPVRITVHEFMIGSCLESMYLYHERGQREAGMSSFVFLLTALCVHDLGWFVLYSKGFDYFEICLAYNRWHLVALLASQIPPC